jgi:hypothetical protein
VILAVPDAEGVKLAEQLEVPVVPASRVQLETVGLTATPVSVNETLPAGLIGVPPFEGLSITVAVQVAG